MWTESCAVCCLQATHDKAPVYPILSGVNAGESDKAPHTEGRSQEAEAQSFHKIGRRICHGTSS